MDPHAKAGRDVAVRSAKGPVWPGVLLVLFLAACAPSPDPVSLVVVTLDTTRADHLSCYGFPMPTTPHIDELAERGVLFEAAYAPMSQTLPAHATLFTGLAPREHGAVHNNFKLPEPVVTLAEELGERGYDTSAVIGAGVLNRLTGIGQGFQHWSAVCTGETFDCGKTRRRAFEVTDQALAWADGREDATRPYLLWVHYFDPHGPYAPPPEHVAIPCGDVSDMIVDRADEMGLMFGDPSEAGFAHQLETWCAYVNDIRLTDHHVGRLLSGLRDRGLMDGTAVVVVGDHGQGLGQHGEQAHGVNVYEELMRVPLVVVGPQGELAGTRVSGPLSMEDMHGLLLRLALGDDGRGDAWSQLLATGSLRDAPVYMERPHYPPDRFAVRSEGRLLPGEMLAVVANGYKLIRGPAGEELFRLSDDPFERVNLAYKHPDVAARLRALLDTWERARPVDPEGLEPVPYEQRERLEALGY